MSRLSKWFKEKGNFLLAFFVGVVAIISATPPEGMQPPIVVAQPAAPSANDGPIMRESFNREDLPDAAEAVKVLIDKPKDITLPDSAVTAEEGGDGNGKKEI